MVLEGHVVEGDVTGFGEGSRGPGEQLEVGG